VDIFTCKQCQGTVYTHPIISGVQNRNHCPYCLWSRHVDWMRAGDRLSACKAIMQPIGLTVKQNRNRYAAGWTGELMLVHCCSECGKLSINRIAGDDQAERLMEIFHASLGLEQTTRHNLKENGIRLLDGQTAWLVERQLIGIRQQ
jgi:hypothetical protein